MQPFLPSKLATLALCLMALCPLSAAERVTFHSDRPTAKIIYEPDYQVSGKNKVALADGYLSAQAERFGLQAHAANLRLVRQQSSPLGDHYHYQQFYQGLPVEGAEVIVSIKKDSSHIYQVFNNTWQEPSQKRGRNEDLELNSDEALDMAWDHLRVHGPLTATPSAEKLWLVQDGQFELVWRTQIVTEAPYGGWSVVVDAYSGAVLSAKDQSLYRKPVVAEDYNAYDGPVNDRRLEQALFARIQAETQEKTDAKRVDGSGTVFDPDPRTTLADETLLDTSPAERFDGAYFTRPLKDLTVSEGLYYLTGPWVRIVDFENPRTAPSSSSDGQWNFTRGNLPFNDAMTYFHLDQSQRYMQAMGFSIQNLSIETDANGVNGDDNSHYLSNSNSLGVNRLAYGFGCVDDNEDADVILHEYGHAIQKFINNNWGGGDTGAMGEGFGDYWGASYSYTTPNGNSFHPEWIYSWDGHGDLEECWPGRWMDLVDQQYNPSRTYGAHTSVGGVSGDELWGTPLFQSMVKLDQLGYPTEQADKIILQSHYGFGSGIRMPELAQATVDSAAALFPSGPHAQVFHDCFASQNITTTYDHATYAYISAHVPPNNDWVNEIQLVNPSESAATITARVFELGEAGFTEAHTSSFTLEAKAATTFSPEGSAQRWVRFESDQPLSGTSFFSRNVGVRGEEKAGIPLFKLDERSTQIIIPHIPADRSFFSGAVILNASASHATLSYELYNAAGERVDELLSSSAPTELDAFQKWVGFASPYEGATSLFEDEAGADKVSYVKIVSSAPVVSFELFGYKAVDSNSPIATAGIKAQPFQPLPIEPLVAYPVRISLTEAQYSGFSILNANDSEVSVKATVYNKSGVEVATTNLAIPAHTKRLGLNVSNGTDSFFHLPTSDNTINLSNPEDLAAVVLEGPLNLHVFELTGTGASELDGGAVTFAAGLQAFAKPSGTLEIFRAQGSETITVTLSQGGVPTESTYELAVGGFLQISLPEGLDSATVSGEGLSASVITRNSADGSITVVNGSSID